MGHLELCDDVLGASGAVGVVWHQGETEQTGVEGKDYAVLDSHHVGGRGGVCDDGVAEGALSGRGGGCGL